MPLNKRAHCKHISVFTIGTHASGHNATKINSVLLQADTTSKAHATFIMPGTKPGEKQTIPQPNSSSSPSRHQRTRRSPLKLVVHHKRPEIFPTANILFLRFYVHNFRIIIRRYNLTAFVGNSTVKRQYHIEY